MQLVPMLQRLIGPHIGVRVDLRSEAARAKVDISLFEQSVVNLALNARDAMPNGGTLSISTEDVVLDDDATRIARGLAPGAYVLLTVRDTGVGMTPDVCDNAFEPFFTTKGRARGTGLGLSIVYGFAQQSEGAIQLESELGRGTVFRLYLPRSDAAPAAETVSERTEPAVKPTAASHDETILLVDDEELVRRALIRCLERDGYHVLSAGGADAALDIVRTHDGAIDLLITDVLLPGMRGTDLAKAVAQLSPRTKLLLISGYTDGELEGSVEAAHAMFLQKPFTPQRLGGVVRELLDGAVSG
jgi:hypothetical protein